MTIERTCCCGQSYTSRFCPDCGRDLTGEGPLQELLAYCQKKTLEFEGAVEKHRDWPESSHKQKRLKALGISATRWRRWLDALQSKLEDTVQ